jgi:hypothetical protein
MLYTIPAYSYSVPILLGYVEKKKLRKNEHRHISSIKIRGDGSIGHFISVNDYGKIGTRKIRKHIGPAAGRLLGIRWADLLSCHHLLYAMMPSNYSHPCLLLAEILIFFLDSIQPLFIVSRWKAQTIKEQKSWD